jgi:hypothetical protein
MSREEQFRGGATVGGLLIPDDRLDSLMMMVNPLRMALGLRPIELPSGELK